MGLGWWGLGYRATRTQSRRIFPLFLGLGSLKTTCKPKRVPSSFLEGLGFRVGSGFRFRASLWFRVSGLGPVLRSAELLSNKLEVLAGTSTHNSRVYLYANPKP